MRFNVLNRKVHYWAAAFIALPILVIIGSGLLLQVKKQLGVQALSIANQAPQTITSLFR